MVVEAFFYGGSMKRLQLHVMRPDSVPAGESAVPEFHRSPLLLSATSHLLLSGTSLSHDAAGEAPTVFRLKVWARVCEVCSPEHAWVQQQGKCKWRHVWWSVSAGHLAHRQLSPCWWIVVGPRRPVGVLLVFTQSWHFAGLHPQLHRSNSQIPVQSCSGAPVTFLLSCNQSERVLMLNGHRLSISLTHTNTHSLSFLSLSLSLFLSRTTYSAYWRKHRVLSSFIFLFFNSSIQAPSVVRFPWAEGFNKMPLKSNKN